MKTLVLLGVCALSAFGQQSGSANIDTDARGLVPLSSIPTSDDTIPHIAFGLTWTTKITITNFRQETLTIPVHFFDDSGAPLAVPIGGNLLTSTDVRLGPLQVGTIETDYLPNTPHKSGIARLVIPCSSVDSCGNVGAFATFKWRIPYNPDQEAAVPAAPSLEHRTFITFDEMAGNFTGIAIAHPKSVSQLPATITVIGRDNLGNQLVNDQVVLPANGHTAFLLASKWTMLANHRGTLELTSTDAVATLALVYNSTGAFSTSPSYAVSE